MAAWSLCCRSPYEGRAGRSDPAPSAAYLHCREDLVPTSLAIADQSVGPSAPWGVKRSTAARSFACSSGVHFERCLRSCCSIVC